MGENRCFYDLLLWVNNTWGGHLGSGGLCDRLNQRVNQARRFPDEFDVPAMQALQTNVSTSWDQSYKTYDTQVEAWFAQRQELGAVKTDCKAAGTSLILHWN